MQSINLEFSHHENDKKSNIVTDLNFSIDENNIIDGAKEVLKVIRPNWKCDNVKFKNFTDGLTNKLIGCFHQKKSNHITNGDEKDNNNTTNFNNDVVLIRIYGNKTDMLIDRKREAENIQILSKYNFAPKLYATFNNGLAYEFVPGNTLTADTILIEKIWKLIARKMAHMHTLHVNDDPDPVVYKKTVQFLNLLPETFSKMESDKRIKSIFPPLAALKQEFTDLYDKLRQLDSPIVFCHNDLLLGNVIYTEECNKVTFIDFEYAGFNHQAFDIGNHFTEFAGTDEIDYSRYPSKEFQFAWLREYLKEFTKNEDVSNDQIERLYVQVNQFALSSHFLWVIWALIQAEHSLIDFDFIKFAEDRYGEYLKRKNEFLALTI